MPCNQYQIVGFNFIHKIELSCRVLRTFGVILKHFCKIHGHCLACLAFWKLESLPLYSRTFPYARAENNFNDNNKDSFWLTNSKKQQTIFIVNVLWSPKYAFTFRLHCLKSFRIRSYSGRYFPTFRLNIQSECGKMRTEYGHFSRSV